MNNRLIVLAIAIIPSISFGAFPFSFWKGSAAPPSSYTDNFAGRGGSENPLSNGGKWTTVGSSWAAMDMVSGAVAATTNNTQSLAMVKTTAFTASPTQSSQITIGSFTNGAYCGVAVLIQSSSVGNCYVLSCGNGDQTLYKVTDSGGLSFSLVKQLGTASLSAGQILKLSAVVTSSVTFHFYINGVEQSGSPGTDSSAPFLTGQPGIYGYTNVAAGTSSSSYTASSP